MDHDIHDTLLSNQGFASVDFTQEQLGKVVLHFLAQHISHDLIVVGDTALDGIADLDEYDMLLVIDNDSPWTRTHHPVSIGGAKFYVVPCEPSDSHRARPANADTANGALNGDCS